MKLLRRFKWDDRDSVYLPINEEELERTPKGMVRFVAVDTKGTKYSGAAFDSTVASMVDSHPYWKLAANPKSPEKSIVVEVAGVPLADSAKTKRRVSEKDVKIDGQGD
jgi:hypothetical protein